MSIDKCLAVTAPADKASPPLLHNSGYASSAPMVWHGLQRGASPTPAAGDAPLPASIAAQGQWLQLLASVGQRERTYRRDWNSARALLTLFEYRHGLTEALAERRLIDMLEHHCVQLQWPPCLLTGRRDQTRALRRNSSYILLRDEPLTAFVAIAKSIGNLWLSARPAQLASLQSPCLVEPGGVPMRGVEWSQELWFPEGVPADIAARGELQP